MKRTVRKSTSAKSGRGHAKKAKRQQTPQLGSVDPQITVNKGW